MATSGEKFLRLTKAQQLHISCHALDRLYRYTGLCSSGTSAEQLFLGSTYTPFSDLHGLGYRPAYIRRKSEGQPSWYFRFAVDEQELVAVLTPGEAPDELVWVTTYAANEQNEHLRLALYERVSAA